MTTPMTPSPQPTSVAGWHPDPNGGPHLRWWDGTQWTNHTQRGPVEAFHAGPPRNTPATVALILGIGALLVNTFLVTSTAAVVAAIVGLVKASSLQRVGQLPVGRTKAVWAIVLAFFASVFTIFFKFFLF